MATYEGRRENGNAQVSVDGAPLAPRNDLVNHSPDGFEWSYAGSGPSQLALAILAHHFREAGDGQELADAKAVALYHDFKLKLVVTLPKAGWQFDTHVVADTVSMVVKEEAERFFSQATRLEVETKSLEQDLYECYVLLEQAEAGQG